MRATDLDLHQVESALAEQTDDPFVKNEMFELASVCDEVANNIEDHLTGG